MCGEHTAFLGYLHPKAGSSPRVRGTPKAKWDKAAADGIIPACAGNTAITDDTEIYLRDHPRVCGEHQRAFETTCGQEGSSPRVRGTLYFVIGCGEQLGIIPACAGNT